MSESSANDKRGAARKKKKKMQRTRASAAVVAAVASKTAAVQQGRAAGLQRGGACRALSARRAPGRIAVPAHRADCTLQQGRARAHGGDAVMPRARDVSAFPSLQVFHARAPRTRTLASAVGARRAGAAVGAGWDPNRRPRDRKGAHRPRCEHVTGENADAVVAYAGMTIRRRQSSWSGTCTSPWCYCTTPATPSTACR